MKKYYRLFFRVVCCICAQCFTSGSLYKSFGFDQVSLFSVCCMYVCPEANCHNFRAFDRTLIKATRDETLGPIKWV